LVVHLPFHPPLVLSSYSLPAGNPPEMVRLIFLPPPSAPSLVC
jgi:hypothetical protein